MIDFAIQQHLSELKRKALYRQRKLDQGLRGTNFSSNDYLSLTQTPAIKKAFQKGFEKYPTGSGGSMVICGYHSSHRDLELAFAKALEVDDALLFSSGYAANLGIVSLLTEFNAKIIIDKGAHASFYDGLRLNDSDYCRYLHNNLSSLRTKLEQNGLNPYIITESIFSMSGQATDFAQLVELGLNYKASCIVDEAHAFGLVGPQGLGAVLQYGLNQKQIPLRVIPFGKAFGFQGAIVAGKGEWIDALLQTARSHTYSTAISPALAYGLLETLAFIRAADDRRQKLHKLIKYFKTRQNQSSLNWQNSSTAIQQLQLGCPHKALTYTQNLRAKGIFCQAMREPTVSKKCTGLRIILNYSHEPEDIDKLFIELEHIRRTSVDELNYESAY